MLADPIIEFMQNSGIALSVADARAEDVPLIAVNAAFERLTGYSSADVVGHNCRFLQPEAGAGPVRDRMHHFIFDDDALEDRFLVPNVRKDGTPFLNLLYMTKIRRDGTDAFIIGSQFDFSKHDRRGHDGYDESLRNDIRELGSLAGEMGMVTLGTFRSLANSAALIAQAKLT